MGAEFFDILPPPQSIDTLDAWGVLDALPYSLDDAKWQAVGVYGLVASEGGTSGGNLTGALRVRLLRMTGSAKVSGTMVGVKAATIRYLSGKAKAQSGGMASVTLVRLLEAVASTQTGGKAKLDRVMSVGCLGGAITGENVKLAFKGWNWNGEKTAPAPEWEQEVTEPETWVQKEQNAAVWAAHSVTAKDWTQKQGGVAQWQ